MGPRGSLHPAFAQRLLSVCVCVSGLNVLPVHLASSFWLHAMEPGVHRSPRHARPRMGSNQVVSPSPEAEAKPKRGREGEGALSIALLEAYRPPFRDPRFSGKTPRQGVGTYLVGKASRGSRLWIRGACDPQSGRACITPSWLTMWTRDNESNEVQQHLLLLLLLLLVALGSERRSQAMRRHEEALNPLNPKTKP